LDPYEQQAELIKAVAHPIRLHTLDILSKGEACVCHLTTILKQRQPYVSQHLMTLREAGLVQDRKDGVMVYYRLSDEHIIQVMVLAREVLRSMGVEVDFPAIPVPPVKGCPCPKCQRAGSYGS